MASSLNRTTLIGFLGAAPVKLFFPDGTVHTRVSIATTETWKDKKTGDKKERTDWHYVVFVGRLAEIVCEFLKKGSYVYVEGASRTRAYRPEGADKDVYVTEVHAFVMKMLEKKPSENAPGGAPQDNAPPINQNEVPADDDIPL